MENEFIDTDLMGLSEQRSESSDKIIYVCYFFAERRKSIQPAVTAINLCGRMSNKAIRLHLNI